MEWSHLANHPIYWLARTIQAVDDLHALQSESQQQHNQWMAICHLIGPTYMGIGQFIGYQREEGLFHTLYSMTILGT
jgi:hypothetical protein